MREYKNLTTDDQNIDDFLKSILVERTSDEMKIIRMNEDQKEKTSSNLVNGIFKVIKDRSLKVDLKEIEKTKGNIRALDKYSDLQDSIKFLRKMYIEQKGPKEILELEKCFGILHEYTREFQNGFRQGVEVIVLLYNNMVNALIRSVGYIISVCVNFVKNSGDVSLRAVFKRNIKGLEEQNMYISNIVRFNQEEKSGKLNKLFKNMGEVRGLGGALALAGSLLAATVLIVWALRELIYLTYYSREKLSIYFKQLADFVELNASTLNSDDLKKTKQKQEDIVKRLNKMSDQIAIDGKTSNKQAKKELKDENDEVDMETIDTLDSLL